MWITYIIIAILFYAFAEVFQKKGSDLEDNYSELKLLVWYGIVSGITAVGISALGLRETSMTTFQIIGENPLMLLEPLFYILSLLACFLGFKLIPVSVASPITCLDGVFTFIGIIIMYLVLGKTDALAENITLFKLLLVILISVSVYVCTLIQARTEDIEANRELAEEKLFIKTGHFAVAGVLLVVLSAVLDGCSSLTDLYYLGELAESYDFIYAISVVEFMVSIVLYFVLWILERKPYKLVNKSELPKILGSGFESIGSVFYMISAADNQIYPNILLSSFCVFTVLISRVLLKEKIEKQQFFWIGLTIVCIIAFTVMDELF